MKLNPEQLNSHLQSAGAQLLPVYLLGGDEPLLIQEAADQIRQAARSAGFSERNVLHADGGFQWEQLLDEANSLSLFAEKKIIELHISNGKPGPKGSEILELYLQNPSPDTLLLIFMPRVDAAGQKSKWFKAIDQVGATLAFWPIEFDQLPRWIGQRFRQQGLNASPQAAQLLAERVEGNLLAAVQEIEKLKLLVDDKDAIDEDTILQLVADSARFDLFGLTDTALKGDAARCLRMLQGLQAEGTEATLILWALSRDIRLLLTLMQESGHSPVSDKQFSKHRIWGKRKGYVNQAINRHNPMQLQTLLQQCHQADLAIKGMQRQSPWLLITDITLQLAS